MTDYSKAIELNPKKAWYYSQRAYVRYQLGLYDQAIADYTQAIERDSKSFSHFTMRGDAYRSKGERDRAIADYRKAISLAPRDFRAHDGLKKLGIDTGM